MYHKNQILKMKKTALILVIATLFFSCGKEKQADQQEDTSSVENVESNSYVVLLDAIYEKNDTVQLFVYDENDYEVANSRIKKAIIGSTEPQTIQFDLPNGYTPFNLGIGFSLNAEQATFTLKGITIKNGEDLVYKPEDYLKYYANNDGMVLDIPTSVHKLIHDKIYPPSFIGNLEMKSVLSSSVK